ncbi:MAG: ribosome maturation factor RimM [Acidimicrobiia bacterium]|nr:ribosome maturation factor RimM [Acidimicrobiia bacterium]
MTGPRRLEVGRIVKAHGLAGEVVVHPVSNAPGRFAAGALLHSAGGPLVVLSSRPHQGRWLVRLEGVDDRSAAEAMRGTLLMADLPGDAPEGEVWVHELIGARARGRDGSDLGRVVAVEANPANDLLVLDDGALVPMVFVVEVRPAGAGAPGEVVIDPPEGLLEVNRRES